MTGKQLKNSILQWAIQGKLVPQDPNDEPASVLLEKIRAEKAQLIKEGKIKKDKKESIIYRGEDNSYYEKILATDEVKCVDDELPFMIPNTWDWVRLRNITSLLGDGIHGTPEYDEKGSYYFINGNNLKDKTIVIKPDTKKVNEQEYLKYKKDLDENTILVSINGTLGNVAYYNDEPVMLGKSVCYFNLMSHDLKEYIYIVLKSPYFLEYALSAATGTTIKNVSLQAMNNLLIPVPSQPEQNRILHKIELLKVSLDKYSKQECQLSKLNNSIRQTLKKSVLQAAIQGKLVSQDASDEPASILLQRIKEEKLRLVKEGKLKKKDVIDSTIFRGDDNKYYEQLSDKVVDITEDIPFDVPEGWSWCRLKSICTIFTGATFKKEEANTEKKGIRILRGGNILPFEITFKADDIFLPYNAIKENILLRKNDIVTPAVTSLENIGKMARVKDDMPDVTVGGFVFVLRLYFSNDWLSQYLLALMSSPTIIEYMKSITNKSGQAFYNIGKERLATTLLPIPPLSEQQRIVNQIEKIFSEIKGN